MNFRLRTREAAVRRLGLTLLVCVVAGFTTSCVGLSGSATTGTDRVAISPPGPSGRANGTQAFSATVAKETNPTVTWTVNDIANGNATVGTITSTGPLTATYTAPASLPSPNTVTITAAVPNHKGLTASTVTTLLNPVPQLSSATPPQIDSGFERKQFCEWRPEREWGRKSSTRIGIRNRELHAWSSTFGDIACTTCAVSVPDVAESVFDSRYALCRSGND
jgi:hypothetical protein